MRKPATNMLVAGHPIVAVPMTLACGVMTFAGLQTGNASVLLVTAPIGIAVLRASEQRAKYKAWVREWEAMGPNGPARRKGLLHWLVFIATALGTLLLLGSSDSTRHAVVGGIGGLVACLAMVALVGALARWFIHRRRRHAGAFVTTIVARPMAAVPSLTDAYRALPPHCRALLGGRP